MKFKFFLLASLVSLSACSNAKSQSEKAVANVASDAVASVENVVESPQITAKAINGEINKSGNSSVKNTEINIIQPMLAYSYAITLLLPQEKVESQMRRHQKDCETAGPKLCQIITSSINNDEFNKNANLSIRGEPIWLERFRSSLEKSAKDDGGRITASNVNSEDLTREITDTEARLRALTNLQKRLEAIIASRPGKLADLLEAERELARVQGEIDSYNSNLLIAKGRVNMSILDMNYQSRQSAVSNGVFSPLIDAISKFFQIMFESLAFLIKTFAAILPFAIVIIPIFLYGKKWLANRKPKAKP